MALVQGAAVICKVMYTGRVTRVILPPLDEFWTTLYGRNGSGGKEAESEK